MAMAADLTEGSVRAQKFLKFLGFVLNLSAARNEYRLVLKAQGFADADIEALVDGMRRRYRVRLFALGLLISAIGAALRGTGSNMLDVVGILAMYFGLLIVVVQVIDRFNPGQISIRQMLNAVRGRRR
jgi:hypothetical protein